MATPIPAKAVLEFTPRPRTLPIGRDRSAVQAAITLPWSNGQTEGQITKLKLLKRQMYGRGKIYLLQALLIGLTPR